MKRLLAIITVLAMVGCAGWQANVTTVIERADSTARYFYDVAMPLINQECLEQAQLCVDDGVETADECQGWVDCNTVRKYLSEGLKALHIALYEAEVAVTLSQEEKAAAAVERALRHLAELATLLNRLDVLGG